MFRSCFTISALLISLSLNAQNDTTVVLNEVKVASSRAGTSAADGMRTIQIIESDEIKQMPVTTVSEVLEYISNTDIRNRGVFGVQADVSTRGGSFEQTMVLLNGSPMTDPQTGHHVMNIPVSMDQIERIEILSGGASRIFGPKAFSGAINIITKQNKETSADISASGGEFGYYNLGGAVTGGIKNQFLTLAGNYMANDGYIPNTDAIVYNTTANLNGNIGKVNYNAGGGYQEKRFGAQNFYTATFPTQYEETKATFIQASAQWSHKNLGIRGGGYYRIHNDQFQLYREGPGYYRRDNGYFIMNEDTAPTWYAGHNYHLTHVAGGDITIYYTIGKHTVSLGAAMRDENIKSNILGEPMSSPEQVNGEPGYALYKREGNRNELNVYLEDQYVSGKWSIAGGLLLTSPSMYDSKIYPGLDVSYKLNDKVRFYGNGNMSVRYPTYTDLYYNLGGAVGSKDLKPEESVSYEVGTRYVSSKWSGQAAVFRREGKNLIDWIRYNGQTTTQAANITSADFTGFDGNLRLNTKEAFGESFLFSSISVNYTGIVSDTASSGFESNYVLDFLKHKLTLSLLQQVSKSFSIYWGFNMQERNGGYREPGKSTETSYNTFYTADVRLMHNTGHSQLFLDITNLFDQNYVDFGNVAQPGRWIRAGVSFHIGKVKG